MKDWLDDLRTHVDEWSDRLDQSGRGWWPKFVYHFTDISNAVSILNSGELLSRAECERRGLMENDNANPEVIEQTQEEHLDFVRLYFRPRTPTQWVVEGIKRSDRRDDGHCPTPVFFLFDLVDTIGRDDAHFSRGTLASSRHGYSQRRDYFVNKIEFEDVYHDEGLGMGRSLRKRQIKQRRMAEVIIPDSLPIGDELQAVYCRSPGERRTLLHKLDEPVRDRWRERIRVGYDKLFFRLRPFVQTVSGEDDTVEIELAKSSWQPYSFSFEFESILGPQRYVAEGEIPAQSQKKRIQLPDTEAAGTLRFEMEGCRAFKGFLTLEGLPF